MKPRRVSTMGGTGDPPVLVGDPPAGMGGAPQFWSLTGLLNAFLRSVGRVAGRDRPVACTTQLLFVPVLALCLLPIATGAQLQTIPLGGTASRLSSVTYYDPPNEQQVKVRLTGDEMTPLPGALFDVKNLTIEKYDIGGKLEAVVRAPECVYAQLDGVASSPGHLEVELAGGKIRTEGDGFMWQQKDQLLVISNNVHTIIKAGFMNLTKP